jgi:hypothetical protein
MNKVILATFVATGIGVLAACDEPSPQSAQPDAQAQFDAADANGDGVLTELEGLDIPGLSFSTMDADKSKSVTRQEFATAVALSRSRG